MTVSLGDIQKTLLLPLWGRSVEAQKQEPLLIDKTALEIVNKIDFDFSTIANNVSKMSQIGWIARSLQIDQTIKQFLEKYPQATIVNIGCGLDTTFERIDNGKVYWYDLDLPDVIDLRRKFIPENDRRKFIISSFLDEEWLGELRMGDNMLFIAAGVFYYFKEQQVKRFFMQLAVKFPGSEIVFDAVSPKGVELSNKMVIRNSGMDERSYLQWGLKNSEEIRLWDSRIEILDEYSLFRNIKKRSKHTVTMISNILKMQYMIHLKFNLVTECE